MKKIYLLLSVILLTGCGVTDVDPKLLEVDGEETELTVGYIYDWGTNNDLTYREYELTFANADAKPADYISFDIFSTSTLRLEEGTYYYETGFNKGGISSVEVGKDIEYDSGGEAVAGLRLSDWTWNYSGSITVSKSGDLYTFEFDLTSENDGVSHTIKGEFTELLEEGWILTKKK